MTVSMSVRENISFEEAISVTQCLLAEMATGELSPAQVGLLITELVKTEKGARGFFVTYLTDDRPVFDSHTPETVKALGSSVEIVSELLVKNVAMSAAMAVAHRRNGDEDMLASSQRVTRRSVDLLDRLQMPVAIRMAQDLWESARSGCGEWESFLQRWRYDAEQRQAIVQALEAVVGENKK